jgi:membrane protein
MKLKTLGDLLKKTFKAWSYDKVTRLAAALAFYTMVSLAPLLVLTVAILSSFMEDAREQVVAQVDHLIGTVGKDAVIQILDHTSEEGKSKRATLISIALLLFGATGVFVELQDSLNTIFCVKLKPGRAIGRILRKRLISLLMIATTASLLLSSLVFSVVLNALRKNFGDFTQMAGPFLDSFFSITLISLLFALIYKVLPDAKVPWKNIWPAAILTASLFTLGKIGLSIYLSQGSTASAYGAAGSLAALLIWVYYSAQILFFGAEFIQVYTKNCGENVVPDEDAVKDSQSGHKLETADSRVI